MITNRVSEYSDASDRSERCAVVRGTLLALGREYQSKTIEVSILLEECQRERYWQADFPTFAEYCEAELGISIRTAQDLTKVIRACKAANVPVEEIQRIGWSKISVVAGSLTPENAVTLLKEVESKSCRELRHLVKSNKAFKAGKKVKSPSKNRKMPRKVEVTGAFAMALQLACHHTRELDVETNLKFIADKFIELCPPPSAMPSANYRN